VLATPTFNGYPVGANSSYEVGTTGVLTDPVERYKEILWISSASGSSANVTSFTSRRDGWLTPGRRRAEAVERRRKSLLNTHKRQRRQALARLRGPPVESAPHRPSVEDLATGACISTISM
jgi:hypothetical protein